MCWANTRQLALGLALLMAASHVAWGQSSYSRSPVPSGAMPSSSKATAAGRTPGGIYAPNATFYIASSNGAAAGAGLQPMSGAPVGAPCVQNGAPVTGGYGGYGGYATAGTSVGGCCDADRFLLLDNHRDMPQHHPYYPPMHGYYYYHPYHHTHVDFQRDFASQWGMDPRNPYANDIFKTVYAEVRAAQDEGPEHVPVPPTGPVKRKMGFPVVK